MPIDLNADLGESGADSASDRALLTLISSCNIACGGHAGDAASIQSTVQLAKAQSVAIGAHPSLPDREGFGRRDIAIAGDDLRRSLQSQLSEIDAIVRRAGCRLHHVKPHGALYHQMAEHAEIADMLSELTLAMGPDVALVGPSWGRWRQAAEQRGLATKVEGFVDRGYRADGKLITRGQPGASLSQAQALDQGLRLARGGPPAVDTLCVHGDGEHAVSLTLSLRQALREAGIEVRAC